MAAPHTFDMVPNRRVFRRLGRWPHGPQLVPVSVQVTVRIEVRIFTHDVFALVSGQNCNKFNWLPGWSGSVLYFTQESAWFTGIFSKRVTDKICSNV